MKRTKGFAIPVFAALLSAMAAVVYVGETRTSKPVAEAPSPAVQKNAEALKLAPRPVIVTTETGQPLLVESDRSFVKMSQ
jgi:hypothetical protein